MSDLADHLSTGLNVAGRNFDPVNNNKGSNATGGVNKDSDSDIRHASGVSAHDNAANNSDSSNRNSNNHLKGNMRNTQDAHTSSHQRQTDASNPARPSQSDVCQTTVNVVVRTFSIDAELTRGDSDVVPFSNVSQHSQQAHSRQNIPRNAGVYTSPAHTSSSDRDPRVAAAHRSSVGDRQSNFQPAYGAPASASRIQTFSLLVKNICMRGRVDGEPQLYFDAGSVCMYDDGTGMCLLEVKRENYLDMGDVQSVRQALAILGGEYIHT